MYRALCLIVGLLASAWTTAVATAAAQQEVATAGRAPRFYFAVPSSGVLRDARHMPLLRRRIAVTLDRVAVSEAVETIAARAGLRLLYTRDLLPAGSRVSLRADDITVTAALTEALLDTGLDVVLSPNGQMTLMRRAAAEVRVQTGAVIGRITDGKTGEGISGVEVVLEGTRWRTATGEGGRYRLADVTPGSYTVLVRRIGYTREVRPVSVVAGQDALVDVALQPAAARIGDLIVTAEKREERLQDVPVPVTAVRAEKLTTTNQLRLQDYYTSIPGLNLSGGYRGEALVGLRGLSSGYGTPTTGILVDDVPYSTSTARIGGWLTPDIDPGNLARLEVLRGPQGTLYGAGSMGGLIKFVTVDPSTERVSGRLQAGTTTVYNGDALGYNLRGSVNVPLTENLAVRASGFTRREPGYIDNHYFGDPAGRVEEGANQTDAYGGHLAALWRPSERFSVKLSALLQRLETDGLPYSLRPEVGDLQQTMLRGSGWYNRDSRAYSATLKAKLGGIDVTAVSGYNDAPWSAAPDYSAALGLLGQAIFGPAYSVALASNDTDILRKFSQEIRLSAPLGERFEWLVGAFYTHEKVFGGGKAPAVDPVTGASPGVIYGEENRVKYEEFAAFATLTVHVTDRFDVQLGGRQNHHRRVTEPQRVTGAVFGPAYASGENFIVGSRVSSDADAFTYLLTPRFKVSPDLMVYARLASGYRPGGDNGAVAEAFDYPLEYGPDKTQNYELGVKGSVLDQALSFDASLYHIDWKDYQIGVSAPPGPGYITTLGGARSQGVELSVESRPLAGLTIAAWGVWNKAVLTEVPDEADAGFVGNQFPWTSRWSGHLSVDQDVPLTPGMIGFVGGSVSYTGDRAGSFPTPLGIGGFIPEQVMYPSYTQADVRAGVRNDTWTVNLFVTNVTDKRAELFDGGGIYGLNVLQYNQPRTAGLSVTKTF